MGRPLVAAVLSLAVFGESPFDLLVRVVLLAVDRLGVEAEQHGDAVAGAAGDFCWGEPGLEPERDAGGTKAVGDFCEGGCYLVRGEDCCASVLPDIAVLLGEEAAPSDGAEEETVLGRAELLDVVVDQADEDGRNGNLAGGLARPLLQAA